MLADTFIKRPRLAGVISIVLFLAGLIALRGMPVEQFPAIAPPQVTVSAVYPGAGAEVTEQTVAQVIEDKIIGVENMIYMKSASGADGSYTLNITFDIGTDTDLATVNVQNRVALAEPMLPSEVRQVGIKVVKKSSSLLMGVALYASDGTTPGSVLTNYTRLNLLDQIKRVPGVGDASMFGTNEFAMQIALDVDRLAALGLVPGDVMAALRAQNVQAALGRVGGQPLANDPGVQLNILTQGRLETTQEFSDVIVRANPDGTVVRLGDVAQVSLGEKSSDIVTAFNSAPATLIGIYLSPGGNALDAASGVRAVMERARTDFPAGVSYDIVSDSSVFVQQSISEVEHTLMEAFALVVLVVFVFLGSLRATMVPLIAVPVALVGTFAAMQVLGFSLNTVSLLALVLAIGIVVDDAIVVVEAVEKVLEEFPDLTPSEAASRAMGEITGAILAITMVLLSVFVPVAFIPGISGQLFQQFAVVVSVSMVLSAINALTLAPALCALILRPHHGPKRGVLGALSRGIDRARDGYAFVAGGLARRAFLGVVLLGVAIGGTGWLFQAVPSGFLPAEDQGSFIVETRLPETASLNRTLVAQAKVETLLRQIAGVQSVVSVNGFSMLDGIAKSNSAFALVTMAPFEDRTDKNASVFAAIRSTMMGGLPSATRR